MTNRGLVAIAITLALLGAPAVSRAQAAKGAPTPDELKAARELFQSAYKDEQEKHFAEALDKFQRVAAVKESGSVRYRIGSVLESLGRLREARDAFRALAATKSALPPADQEVADSAAERAHQLDKKIPRILIKLQENPPADARVTIDGAAAPVSTTPRSIELDPGEHVVQATSPTTSPSSSRFVLAEGGEVEVTVVLTPENKLAPKPVPIREEPKPQEGPKHHRKSTLAVVAVTAGGVLFVTGIVLLAIRASDISDLDEQCRDGVCPSGKRSALQSEHDQASTFGPLGVGLGLVGLAGLGYGACLMLRPLPAAGTPANGTTTSSPASGLRIGPRPVRGGGIVGLTTAF